MGNLLTYSGIATKVRAMESRFITEDEFQEMASLSSVTEAQEYLKKLPAYSELLAHVDAELHRGEIEKLLAQSIHHDFEKLYRFATPPQRKFLNLYFTNFEISMLKSCLRHIFGTAGTPLDLSMFQDFFRLHSKLNPEKLAASRTMTELTDNLEGSPYYRPFKNLENSDHMSLFDYEMQLDIFHFHFIWKHRNKFFTREEQAVITQCFGSKMDLLNIQWIYRSKKYYHLDSASLCPLLIPIHYRLKQDDILKLAESGSTEEFFHLLSFTYYGSLGAADLTDHPNLEAMYKEILDRIYSVTSRRYPYSAAVLNSYFYFKNLEIHRIITTIEGIRYGISTGDIISYSIKEQ
ncbi:V-type ATPase subunit [Clostridium sp. AM58-1XD]|uniref:V0D/AC39 family V-type ATPase subunit n=1 Tax=Clostridium sp. AM58-1XD TaxID=2292307 RepID=UPI000E50E387|nr:V-type ATPase subunit [Clostridium sp. AM58-1XD]RGY97376.1 ATPase [Clostridium sp. AM58-1XD]